MYKYEKNIFDLNTPNTIIPVPKEADYKFGFIERYFVKKANDKNGFIFEVNETDYEKYLENPYWVGDKIIWRITGPQNPIYKNNGTLDDKGVIFSNKSALSIASKKLQNISLYLPNILQFYK
ncbi:MAG: hypothetical protein FJ375_03695 [Pelagibacterales bacterium]|nr:hypothetical protein [Pelagibacterales bacterium]